LNKKTLLCLCGVAILSCTSVSEDDLQNGDIIFQASLSAQSLAIQLATHSKYSHVGIIYKKSNSNKIYVLEAHSSVKLTPFSEWVKRGAGGHYVVKRLSQANQILTPKVLKKMQVIAKKWLGKSYDWHFEWNDKKLYCSELVWKIYQRATGIELSPLKQLKEFDLTSPPVKQKLQERFGNQIPLTELVISPGDLFESSQLVRVGTN